MFKCCSFRFCVVFLSCFITVMKSLFLLCFISLWLGIFVTILCGIIFGEALFDSGFERHTRNTAYCYYLSVYNQKIRPSFWAKLLPIPGKSKTRGSRQSIISPDWNFERMGIGGLDKEFSDIFRRAFASRVFPPDIVEQMGEFPSFSVSRHHLFICLCLFTLSRCKSDDDFTRPSVSWLRTFSTRGPTAQNPKSHIYYRR